MSHGAQNQEKDVEAGVSLLLRGGFFLRIPCKWLTTAESELGVNRSTQHFASISRGPRSQKMCQLGTIRKTIHVHQTAPSLRYEAVESKLHGQRLQRLREFGLAYATAQSARLVRGNRRMTNPSASTYRGVTWCRLGIGRLPKLKT